jgi:hypothetical protein
MTLTAEAMLAERTARLEVDPLRCARLVAPLVRRQVGGAFAVSGGANTGSRS